jgi:hypothetical protein
MKRLFLLLAFTVISLYQAAAQNIAYEVIRTPEAPGYFALRVYPGNDLPELQVETVFVENYRNKAERSEFKDLSTNLADAGLQVLSSVKATALVENQNYRLVLLGGPKQSRWLQFSPPTSGGLIEAFEMFSITKLGPVYLSNIKADFGGNVQQVRPEQVPFLDQQSTYFVGQFDEPMKTRVSLTGETPDITVQADGVMDLSTYQPHEADGLLQNLWNDQNPTQNPQSNNSFSLKDIVTSSFPYLLAFIGLIIMYLAARPSKLRTGMIDQIDELFWNTPLEETPLYQAWEKNFPWELTDKELKLVQ